MNKTVTVLMVFCLLSGGLGTLKAQTLERVVFSSVASSNDNFQPILGTPYGVSLVGANGSLEVSAEYGQSAYEETTLSVKDVAEQSNINVFPNPTSEKINVDLSKLQAVQVVIRLVDVNGKLLINKPTQQAMETFDLQNYPAGTYFLQVEVSKSKIQTFRIIKSK